MSSGAPVSSPAESFTNRIRAALRDLVDPNDIQPIPPSLEDVFVLVGGAEEDAA